MADGPIDQALRLLEQHTEQEDRCDLAFLLHALAAGLRDPALAADALDRAAARLKGGGGA